MTDFELLTAADIPLMQDLAQRLTAVRPDLISADASYGELAWVWGQGCTAYGESWPRRLWFSAGELVAWGWAFLPRTIRRNDGSVREIRGASLSYQVHPGHGELVDEVIEWYDGVAAGLKRRVSPTDAEKFALTRWAALKLRQRLRPAHCHHSPRSPPPHRPTGHRSRPPAPSEVIFPPLTTARLFTVDHPRRISPHMVHSDQNMAIDGSGNQDKSGQYARLKADFPALVHNHGRPDAGCRMAGCRNAGDDV